MYTKSTLAAFIALTALSACQTASSPIMVSEPQTVDPMTGEGQYFPPATHTDIQFTSFAMMSDANPSQRQFFADRINMETPGQGDMETIVVQSTGQARDVLVLMVPSGERILTPYVSRALLARMSSIIRFAPVISEMGLSEELEIYDVSAILGFKQIVVTDGQATSLVTYLKVSQL